jgi:hypothetical protein
MDPKIWEHALIVLPLDVQQVQAKLTELEPLGFELCSMVQLAIGGQPHLDTNGVLIAGQAQPAFLLTLKRPQQVAPVAKILEG